MASTDEGVLEYNAPQFIDFSEPVADDATADKYFDFDHENGGPVRFSEHSGIEVGDMNNNLDIPSMTNNTAKDTAKRQTLRRESYNIVKDERSGQSCSEDNVTDSETAVMKADDEDKQVSEEKETTQEERVPKNLFTSLEACRSKTNNSNTTVDAEKKKVLRLSKAERDLTQAEKKILALEATLSDKEAKLKTALNEKHHFEEEFNRLKRDYGNKEKQLDISKKQLEDETLLRVEVENRVQSLKEELAFKEELHKGLTTMKIMTEKYSNDSAAAKDELRISRTKIDNLTSQVTSLKAQNDALLSRVSDLEKQLADEQEAAAIALKERDRDLEELRNSIAEQLKEYEELMGIKIVLDMEIAAYRKLLEGVESRRKARQQHADNSEKKVSVTTQTVQGIQNTRRSPVVQSNANKPTHPRATRSLDGPLSQKPKTGNKNKSLAIVKKKPKFTMPSTRRTLKENTEKIAEFRHNRAEKRKLAEESLKKSQSNSGHHPVRPVSHVTRPARSHFATYDRIKSQAMETRNDIKAKNSEETLRHYPPSPHDPKKGSTVAKPSNVTDSRKKRKHDEIQEEPTPDRFRLKPRSRGNTPQKSGKAMQKLTVAKTRNRKRAVTAISAAEEEMEVQEMKNNMIKANPINPKLFSDKATGLKKVAKKQCTEAVGFDLETDHRTQIREASKQKKIEDERKNQHAKASAFKAQPPKVLYTKPFVPEKGHKPLTKIEDFQLNTDKRSQQREQFEQYKKHKEQELEAEKVRRQKEESEIEADAIAKLRAQMVPKSNPIKHFKPMEVEPSTKLLTKAASPQFHTSQRLRHKPL